MIPDPYDRTDPKNPDWADDLEDRAEQLREAGL